MGSWKIRTLFIGKEKRKREILFISSTVCLVRQRCMQNTNGVEFDIDYCTFYVTSLWDICFFCNKLRRFLTLLNITGRSLNNAMLFWDALIHLHED